MWTLEGIVLSWIHQAFICNISSDLVTQGNSYVGNSGIHWNRTTLIIAHARFFFVRISGANTSSGLPPAGYVNGTIFEAYKLECNKSWKLNETLEDGSREWVLTEEMKFRHSAWSLYWLCMTWFTERYPCNLLARQVTAPRYERIRGRVRVEVCTDGGAVFAFADWSSKGGVNGFCPWRCDIVIVVVVNNSLFQIRYSQDLDCVVTSTEECTLEIPNYWLLCQGEVYQITM